ncbi:MAG TPA: CsgG/HfaB family protein [Spirochaetota bacterium]|nr:CsgG/HfaB family protein [Spirochaetota bacterium]HPJ35479.1 CsgG/HfaB family protein [Spirochaetota bacterium]
MKNWKLAVIVIMLFFLSCATSEIKHLRNIPRDSRKGLVVLNFKNNTPRSRAAEYEPWEFGIASMVMTDIESIGMFNIISKERLADIMKEQEFQLTGAVDAKDIVEIGKLTGAKYILTGSFMEMHGSLRIESQVFSVEKGAQLGTASAKGKTNEFFEIEKDLVSRITVFLDAMLTESEQKIIDSNVETKSVKASLNNYDGEMAFMEATALKKAGKKEEAKKVIQEAKANFKKAIEFDPAYEKAKKNLSKVSLAIPVQL